jgi:predicted transcriptional regulator
MSDKQLALEAVKRLPNNASLDTIVERLRFMAGIRKGLEQIQKGQVLSHKEVKTWIASNRFLKHS